MEPAPPAAVFTSPWQPCLLQPGNPQSLLVTSWQAGGTRPRHQQGITAQLGAACGNGSLQTGQQETLFVGGDSKGAGSLLTGMAWKLVVNSIVHRVPALPIVHLNAGCQDAGLPLIALAVGWASGHALVPWTQPASRCTQSRPARAWAATLPPFMSTLYDTQLHVILDDCFTGHSLACSCC